MLTLAFHATDVYMCKMSMNDPRPCRDKIDLEEDACDYQGLYEQKVATRHWCMISTAVHFSDNVNWDTFSLRIAAFFRNQV
jgi:hypothetical protein